MKIRDLILQQRQRQFPTRWFDCVTTADEIEMRRRIRECAPLDPEMLKLLESGETFSAFIPVHEDDGAD